MDLERAVKQLISAQDTEASKAYGELFAQTSTLIEKHLGRRFSTVSADVREDSTHETLVKIWKHRKVLRWKGEASWNAFVCCVARRCVIDQIKSVKEVEFPQEFDPPAPHHFMPEIEDSLAMKMIYQAADLLWLGLDPALTPETHIRQALAAQFVYLDGVPWEELIDLLPPERPGDPRLTEETLNIWLTHPGVFRALAYHELYASYDRLTCHLLGAAMALADSSDTLSDHLDKIYQISCEQRMRESVSPLNCDWNWREITLIFLIFRYGFTQEQILRREDFSFSNEEIEALTVKSHALFPFIQQMNQLMKALEDVAVRDEALADTGLWKRLVFQYELSDKLHHKAILHRIQGAADVAGVAITQNTLQAWISNRRLWDSLVKFCRQRFEVDD